jgi:hypothetical protein
VFPGSEKVESEDRLCHSVDGSRRNLPGVLTEGFSLMTDFSGDRVDELRDQRGRRRKGSKPAG